MFKSNDSNWSDHSQYINILPIPDTVTVFSQTSSSLWKFVKAKCLNSRCYATFDQFCNVRRHRRLFSQACRQPENAPAQSAYSESSTLSPGPGNVPHEPAPISSSPGMTCADRRIGFCHACRPHRRWWENRDPARLWQAGRDLRDMWVEHAGSMRTYNFITGNQRNEGFELQAV